MADTKLGIIIEAQDRASNVLGNVKSNVSSFSDRIERMQPAFQAMAAAGTAAFSAIGVGVYKAMQAADEAAKVNAQLNAVLESTKGVAGVTADEVIRLSKALQAQTTFGDEAITSAQNMLLTFTNIGKDVFPDATKTVLDMSVALGQDLKSSSIMLGKALNDPILGVTALRRVGVNFNETQGEMIRGMVEAGQIMEAQRFILNELATEFGGSAAAQAQTFGGRIQQVKEQMSDLSEAIGVALLPYVEQLLAKITPVVTKLVEWAEKNPAIVKEIITITAAFTALTAVVGALGLVLPAVLSGLAFLASPAGLVAIAIMGVITALTIFHDKVKQVFMWLDQNTPLIEVFRIAWDVLATVWREMLYPALAKLWEALEPYKPYLEALGKFIGGALIVAIVAFVAALTALAVIMATVLTAIISMVTWVTNKLAPAYQWLGEKLEWVIGLFRDLWNWMKKLDIGAAVKSVTSKTASLARKVTGVDDAIISPNGNIVTTHPDDWLIATKNPRSLGGGAIAITLTGNTFMTDEQGAERIGDMIINVLRREQRL